MNWNMQCKVTIHRTTPGSLKTRRFLKFSDVRVNSKRQLEMLKEKKKAVAVAMLPGLQQSRALMNKRVATGAVW